MIFKWLIEMTRDLLMFIQVVIPWRSPGWDENLEKNLWYSILFYSILFWSIPLLTKFLKKPTSLQSPSRGLYHPFQGLTNSSEMSRIYQNWVNELCSALQWYEYLSVAAQEGRSSTRWWEFFQKRMGRKKGYSRGEQDVGMFGVNQLHGWKAALHSQLCWHHGRHPDILAT